MEERYSLLYSYLINFQNIPLRDVGMPILQVRKLRLQDTKTLISGIWAVIGRMVLNDTQVLILRMCECYVAG